MDDKPKVQLFTFRTFPDELLKRYFPNIEVAILGKLKTDIKNLHDSMISSPNTLLVGFALSSRTRQESVALNNFHHKKILRDRQESIPLTVQEDWMLPVDDTGTFSFCNYAMYSLALNHPAGFVHIADKDVPEVSLLLNELCNR